MAEHSTIEWTDATWNPVTGCTKISRGCDHCYAERFSERFRGVAGHHFENGFDLTLKPERLFQPLTWRSPKRVFVNSMSDLFHKDIPETFVDRVFDTMEAASWHLFQVLTKRSSNMLRYINKRFADQSCPNNIWLGVSVEDAQAKSRIQHLRLCNAQVRFLSMEPLIGNPGPVELDGIHWVIVGGESGAEARPMQEDWAVDVLRQCEKAGVPFFFKQWGRYGQDGARRSKKANGRTLLGAEHNGMPA